MKAVSYIQLQKRYGGKFIARLNSHVIASAKTSRDLFTKITASLGNKRLVIEYIEPKGVICTYGISSL